MAVRGSSRGANYMRGFTWGVRGEETVMANLNKQLNEITAKSEKGLVMAAAFIRRQTEKTPPLTPVDTGNLRASWFVSTASGTHAGVMRDENTGRFKGPRAGEMMRTHAMVLAESGMIVKSQNTGNRKFVMAGYSANYGGFVHEAIGMINMSRSGSGPKWLETAIKRNTPQILQIVKENVQIK